MSVAYSQPHTVSVTRAYGQFTFTFDFTFNFDDP